MITSFKKNPLIFMIVSLVYICLLVVLLLNLGVILDLIQGTDNNMIRVHTNNSIILFITNTCQLSQNSLHLFGYTLISMLLIFIISIYYSISFSKEDLIKFIIYTVVLFLGGILMLTTTSIFIMFIGYELILLPTIYIVSNFSKTSRGREACDFMIVWTQIGAFLLFGTFGMIFWGIPVFVNSFASYELSNALTNLLVLLIFIGFAPKMAVYPFYYWLPEAHVEVCTNFSIVLSGISIKFAYLGFIRFMCWVGCGDIYWILFMVLMVGFFDAMFRIDGECDIKKIVAYQTVVEMHVLVGFMLLDPSTYIALCIFLLNVHCWISTAGFIIVDIIARRYHTRNIERLYGIFAKSPQITKLIFLIVFIIGSLPGTSIFSIELLISVYINAHPFGLFLFIGTQLIIPVWSRNIWWILWGGDLRYSENKMTFNLTKSELYLIIVIILYSIPPFFLLSFL